MSETANLVCGRCGERGHVTGICPQRSSGKQPERREALAGDEYERGLAEAANWCAERLTSRPWVANGIRELAMAAAFRRSEAAATGCAEGCSADSDSHCCIRAECRSEAASAKDERAAVVEFLRAYARMGPTIAEAMELAADLIERGDHLAAHPPTAKGQDVDDPELDCTDAAPPAKQEPEEGETRPATRDDLVRALALTADTPDSMEIARLRAKLAELRVMFQRVTVGVIQQDDESKALREEIAALKVERDEIHAKWMDSKQDVYHNYNRALRAEAALRELREVYDGCEKTMQRIEAERDSLRAERDEAQAKVAAFEEAERLWVEGFDAEYPEIIPTPEEQAAEDSAHALIRKLIEESRVKSEFDALRARVSSLEAAGAKLLHAYGEAHALHDLGDCEGSVEMRTLLAPADSGDGSS